MAKESPEMLGVMGILREALKLPYRNQKLLFSVTLFTLIPFSFLPIANFYTFKLFFVDFTATTLQLISTDPRGNLYATLLLKIKEHVLLFILVEIVFYALMVVVLVLSSVAVIYVSAMSYIGKDLNFKELCLRIRSIWRRPVITWLYVSLLIAGFTSMILPLSFVPVIFWHNSIIITTFGVVLLVLASLLNIYLAVVWLLSLVISVLEDCYGMQALGVAEKLIKGRRSHGFVLILVFSLLVLSANSVVYMVNMNSKTLGVNFMVLFITLNMMGLLKIFSMIAYTVLYFECKRSRGEKVEIEGDMGYIRISALHLVDSALP